MSLRLLVLLQLLSCNALCAQFSITIDARKDAWYAGLGTPTESYIHLSHLDFVPLSGPRPDSDSDLSADVWAAWDEKYFYIEQRFIAGGRLCAVGMVKGLFLHGRERVSSQAVLDLLGLDLAAPDLPAVVRHWNDLAALKKQHLG